MGSCAKLVGEVAGLLVRQWAGGQGGAAPVHDKIRRLQNVLVTTIELCVISMNVQ